MLGLKGTQESQGSFGVAQRKETQMRIEKESQSNPKPGPFVKVAKGQKDIQLQGSVFRIFFRKADRMPVSLKADEVKLVSMNGRPSE